MIYYIDNFLPDVKAHIEFAKKQNYQDVDAHGTPFPGFAPSNSPEIWKLIETEMVGKVIPKAEAFRVTNYNIYSPTFIHEDSSMSEYAAILYLTEPETEEDGTAFYNYIGDHPIDFNDLSKWERTQLVQQKVNRLLIFPSALAHSRFPKERSANNRLIQVFFFDLKTNEGMNGST